MTNLHRTLAGVMIVTLASPLATAASAESLYAGGKIGWNALEHQEEIFPSCPSGAVCLPEVSLAFEDDTALSFGAFLGYKSHFRNSDSFWAVEIFGDSFNSATLQKSATTTVQRIAGGPYEQTRTKTLKVNSAIGARLLLGHEFSPEYDVYAHVGVTRTSMYYSDVYTQNVPPTSEPIAVPPSSTSASYRDTNLSYGIGASYHFDEDKQLFIEYTHISDIGYEFGSVDMDTISFGMRFTF